MRRIFLLLSLALFGCFDSGAAADAGSDAPSGSDVKPDVIIDPANCVAPATANDDRGVGGYCSPGGGQCAASGPGGSPRICTADLSGTSAHDWYCTYPCSQDSDCGSAASCLSTSQGKMCVPPACAPPQDAGTDAPSDAATDSPDDAATDAPAD
ncbi:MAG TPA: hypothetical protein VGH28_06240 [Polyangiaceae bacterium]